MGRSNPPPPNKRAFLQVHALVDRGDREGRMPPLSLFLPTTREGYVFTGISLSTRRG